MDIPTASTTPLQPDGETSRNGPRCETCFRQFNRIGEENNSFCSLALLSVQC